MEEYKRSLCWYVKYSTSEEEIYCKIKDDPSYTCNLNEDGLLHSTYNENHYEPAITFRWKKFIIYYWLFNGEIKDCGHPFMINTHENQISSIHYYSSERIQTNQPIYIYCGDYQRRYANHNMYINNFTCKKTKILNDDKYECGLEYDNAIHCDTTPEGYPLWDEMESRFKFAD